MISLKMELLNFQFIWGFVKAKTKLSEEVEMIKAYVAFKALVECFKLMKDLKLQEADDYVKISTLLHQCLMNI